MARGALTRSERAPYLEGLDKAADAAAAAAGGYDERRYDINGNLVCLRFAGPPTIMRLATALSHLTDDRAGDPSLTVRIWDSASSRLREPEGPWNSAAEHNRRGIRGLLPRGQGFFESFDGALAVLDAASHQGYHWLEDAACDPWPERAAPLSEIFGGWLAEHDTHVVHAGAVGTERGCVLLVGSPGAGKSHAALACLEGGLRYLGDDTCALDSQNPPTVWSLYSSAQALPFTLGCLPALRPMVSNPGRAEGEKALLFLGESKPGSLLYAAPLRAIAVMSFSDREETRTYGASPGDVLVALAPSSLLARPGADQRMLARLALLARGVECVRLEAGRDPSRLAQAVRELI